MIWGVIFSPALGLWGLIQLADDETLPKIKELENPKTDLASVILSADFIHLFSGRHVALCLLKFFIGKRDHVCKSKTH